MSAVLHSPLTEVTHQALDVLNQELGVVDTIRFLSQFNSGQGDYTKEREQLFAGVTLDDIFADIESERQSKAGGLESK
jgi:hypothetical protein